jgi:predicted glycoside hydrolase/deacetylase ChbG (UPF0249 family)
MPDTTVADNSADAPPPTQDLKVIINGDDFGISDGVCKAIIELMDNGAISNTTMMVAALGARERLRHWGVRRMRGVVGLHLQLSGGHPLSPISDIPTLVDPATGTFVSRDRLGEVDSADVAKEWRRQLEAAIDLLGGLPSHLDSHHGVHRLPNCADIYISLAAELGVPVRGGGARIEERMAAAHVPGSTTVIREWSGASFDLDTLKRTLLARTGERNWGIIEVVTHPGYCDDYLSAVSSLNVAREKDRLALTQFAAEGWLSNNGFRLTAYPLFLPVGDRPCAFVDSDV